MNQYLKPQPGNLAKIEHIVVLMLENHSFDNMLGWLYDGEKPPMDQHFEGLNRSLWNPLDNIDSDGNPFQEKIPIMKNGERLYKGKIEKGEVDFTLPNPDPGEGFRDTNYQLFQQYKVGALYPPTPLNMGFVQNYNNAMLYSNLTYGDDPTNPRKIMTCYTPEQTPVLSALAKNFAVSDYYFASVPSQTLPNRSFIHAATSGGNVNNSPNPYTNANTIYGLIDESNAANGTKTTWGIFGNNSFDPKKDDFGEFGDNHFSLTRMAMTQLHDSKYDGNFDTLDNFYKRCEAGTLPNYSFLEPNFGGKDQNDQHPPADIRPGEKLIADIYNAVKNSKKFKNTLLIITYDEHGGCYDHVAPPKAPTVDKVQAPGNDGFLFNRYGVRIPCVLINPMIPKGLIARPDDYKHFDHTSVIKTVQNCFNVKGELTNRSANAPDLSCVLTLDKPRTDMPDIEAPTWESEVDTTHINGLQILMATMLSDLTKTPMPAEEDTLEFIAVSYRNKFGKKSKKAKTKKK